jgi:hypothetical protein
VRERRSYRWCEWVSPIVARGLKNAGTGELPRKCSRDPASAMVSCARGLKHHLGTKRRPASKSPAKQATNAASIDQLTIACQHTMVQ